MFVAMKSDATDAVRYVYGRFSPPTVLGTADSGSYDPTNGVITIKLSRSKAENIQPGQQLAALNARTFLARPDTGSRSQLVANDITENGSYTLVGNASCAVAAAPPMRMPTSTPASFELNWAYMPAALTAMLTLPGAE